VLGIDTRLHGFQITELFKDKCRQLPKDSGPFGDDLDDIRQLLITQYNAVEANLPESVDPDDSSDKIYEGFKLCFSRMNIKSDVLELQYLPNIRKLLKELQGREPEASSV
jgi:hypothetical protein